MDILQKIKFYFKKKQAESQVKIRQEFLPEALEIVEKPLSPTGHLMVGIVAAFVLFILVWSVFGRMDEVVTARGIILTVSGIQEIQAPGGGIVEEICVREGSPVKAGDAIVKIDSSISEITLQGTTESLALLEYENELLNEIAQGKDISKESVSETDDGKEKIFAYVNAMQESFSAEKEELESTVKQALSQVEIEKEALEKIEKNNEYLKAQKEVLDAMAQHANTEETREQELALEIEYQEKVLSDYTRLYEAGAVAKAEVEELEAALRKLRKEHEIQQNSAASEDYENSLRQYEIDNQLILAQKDYNSQKSAVELAQERYQQALDGLDALETNFQSNISGLIVQNMDAISTQRENQEIQKIGVAEQTLVSPVDGVVRTLEVNTVGGVVTSAQTVATVVPDDSQMLLEVDIQNRDIGLIQNGQEVAVKLDTFDFQKYGKLEGVIVYISPDAVWSDYYGWVYKARIAIDEEKFRQANQDAEIGIGMECTAEVKVGERRIIDFFLEPLMEHFDGSLKIR
ncbi:MAG: HlyD family efflux transporter periplasmic adaptor subunit [Lachnoclostridium sp.]|nr:HlyD family efflux transporter periplasmic adaptor subunit [Lachnospira sp.]MCM1247772.1 HlyD family efflux transporter periplasmic adaptor subunit [Lachnoclostridium sp.]